jgi:multidrug efflux pump subunit AcrA (membrane-fusion protein)
MGYFLSQKLDQTKSDLSAANDKAAALTKQLAKATDDMKTAQDAQKVAEQKASDDENKITDLNNQLTEAQKKAADAQAAVDAAKQEAATAKQQLDTINTALAGKTPQQLNDATAQAQKEAADAQAQQKVLQDSLDQANQRIKDLIADINNENKKIEPPGVSGKVTFVDRTWNFVVLDVGLDAGVVPNGELIVYRGKTFLGKVRVTRADPNDAVAEILPDNKEQIQVGDAVLN